MTYNLSSLGKTDLRFGLWSEFIRKSQVTSHSLRIRYSGYSLWHK